MKTMDNAKTVPVKPTQEMINRALNACTTHGVHSKSGAKETMEAIYQAMINAAPTQATDQEQLGFGDYIRVEQKRYGADNEMYLYKVIGTLRSNSYARVPVDWGGSRDISERHEEIAPVVQCICCGVDETKVVRFAVKDVQVASRPAPSVQPDKVLVDRSWLELANCPDPHCKDGATANQISHDEWEQVQCQWCDEKQQALQTGEDNERTK